MLRCVCRGVFLYQKKVDGYGGGLGLGGCAC